MKMDRERMMIAMEMSFFIFRCPLDDPGKHRKMLTMLKMFKRKTNMTLCTNINLDRERMMIAMEMVIHKYVDGAADNTGADLIIFHTI